MGARGPRLRAEKACATSTPGNAHSRNRQVNSSVCAPSNPPRRGFRGFAPLGHKRSRDAEHRRSGPVRHPPAHKVRRAPRQFTRNYSRKRESPDNSVNLFAHQRASRGLIAPAAFALHVALLNKPPALSVALARPWSGKFRPYFCPTESALSRQTPIAGAVSSSDRFGSVFPLLEFPRQVAPSLAG